MSFFRVCSPLTTVDRTFNLYVLLVSAGALYFTHPAQSKLQRNHARYLLSVHGEGSTPMETNLQGQWHCGGPPFHTS